MTKAGDFNGGLVECPHCKRLATLRKNEASIFRLEKIRRECPSPEYVKKLNRKRIDKTTGGITALSTEDL